MKNILIIDGARNCAYDIFTIDEASFREIFLNDGQNIEFSEDFVSRNDPEQVRSIYSELWKRPVEKKNVKGIQGILYFELEFKKEYYPNKRDCDLDGRGRAWFHKS